MDLNKLRSLKEVVDKHDLMAKKALGQNFLLDSNITDKIVRSTLDKQGKIDFSEEYVLEVGPGPGGLTRSILGQDPKVLTVIEMDKRCISIMEEIKEVVGDRISIIEGDALKQDLSTISESPRNIISNLPYNISVPLLIIWLKKIKSYSSLTLMFQKEVADRICANPGCKDFGRISILSQLLCDVDRLFDINPSCFVPAPKIWSTVVLFRPKDIDISIEQIEELEKITRLAFGQRRKMIRSSLKAIPDLEAKCTKLNIALTLRAEQLTPQQFLELSKM